MICVDNVFFDVDVLCVELVCVVIYDVFNDYIIVVLGMYGLVELINYEILLILGVVLFVIELFVDVVGDVVVVDVGGVIIDVYSVIDGFLEWLVWVIDFELCIKRIVEGDFGVFVNVCCVVVMIDEGEDEECLEWLCVIFSDEWEVEVIWWFVWEVVEVGVGCYVGMVIEIFILIGKI